MRCTTIGQRSFAPGPAVAKRPVETMQYALPGFWHAACRFPGGAANAPQMRNKGRSIHDDGAGRRESPGRWGGPRGGARAAGRRHDRPGRDAGGRGCPAGRLCAARGGAGACGRDPRGQSARRRGDRVHPDQLHVPGLRLPGDVDGRGLRDAGGGAGAFEECGDAMHEEHRAVLDRRDRLLPDRLQSDVSRRARERRLSGFLAGRGLDRQHCQRGAGAGRAGGCRARSELCRGGRGFLLPADVLRHNRLVRVGGAGRAHQAVAVPAVHPGPDRADLPDPGQLEMGRAASWPRNSASWISPARPWCIPPAAGRRWPGR
ncbi:MAG: hypothetical protein KatS3mg118_1885 [Paracoccaceae bacterium]|nr:MAG: hypothetical protein KatS3mg118_1885 [Paracoccaceae bacterium]